MKNLFLVILFSTFLHQSVKAQYVEILDLNLKKELKLLFPSCFNTNNQLDTTCSAILLADSLNLGSKNIANLEGIRYFVKLKKLDCSYNKLTSLPTLPAELTHLDCSDNNYLNSLPMLPESLIYLNVNSISLKNLPALHEGLIYLDCASNELMKLPTLPSTLKDLFCDWNYLTEIPTLPQGLNTLVCSQCNLNALPSLPQGLKKLACSVNKLKSLPTLPKGLKELTCGSNDLTSLPPLPDSLESLYCESTLITSLPNLPTNKLSVLSCFANPNLKCLPFLPQTLRKLFLSSEIIQCLPNNPTGLTIYHSLDLFYYYVLYDFPICDGSSIYQCSIFPKIQGQTFIDLNKNGVKDMGESPKAGVLLKISPNIYAISDANGNYTLTSNTLGETTVSITDPPNFTATPSSYTHNFSSYDTTIAQHIALQPIKDIEEATISVSARNIARPGFNIAFVIDYSNTGTTVLNPKLSFTYDGQDLLIDSLSMPAISEQTTLLFSIPTLQPGQSGKVLIYGKTKTTVPLGSNIDVVAQLTAGTYQLSSTFRTQVRGSFDPNDIEATPVLSPAQISQGAFVEYLIRFQNTGTDTAFNIVVEDILSDQLQAQTLTLISSSHNCQTTIKDQTIKFTFPNILLLDSNANEPASHGYIRFKVKVKNHLALHDEIEAQASIYFDFNAPVVTNTAITRVQEVVTKYNDATELLGLALYPNPSQGKITVNTSNTAAMLQIFNTSGTLVHSQTLLQATDIDLSFLKTGLYTYILGEKHGKLVIRE